MFKPTKHSINSHFPAGTLDKEYWIEAIPVRQMPFAVVTRLQQKYSEVQETDENSLEELGEVLDFILPKIVTDWNFEDEEGALIPLPTKEAPGAWSVLPMPIVEVIMQELILQKQEEDEELVPFMNEKPSSLPSTSLVEAVVEEETVAPI